MATFSMLPFTIPTYLALNGKCFWEYGTIELEIVPECYLCTIANDCEMERLGKAPMKKPLSGEDNDGF